MLLSRIKYSASGWSKQLFSHKKQFQLLSFWIAISTQKVKRRYIL